MVVLFPQQLDRLITTLRVAEMEAEFQEHWRYAEEDNTVKETNMLIQLNPDNLDLYHHHRLDKHGWLWRVTRTTGDLYEATSIATGFKGTLLASYTSPFTGDDDALREQASPLQEGVCGVSGQARPDQEAG